MTVCVKGVPRNMCWIAVCSGGMCPSMFEEMLLGMVQCIFRSQLLFQCMLWGAWGHVFGNVSEWPDVPLVDHLKS